MNDDNEDIFAASEKGGEVEITGGGIDSSNVVNLFPGWIPVIHASRASIREETIKIVRLPSGIEISIALGKYSNVPVELTSFMADDLERTFMRAHGINRTNRRANEVRLKDVLKYERP